MKELICLTGFIILLFSQFSLANTMISPGLFESDLLASGGILDNEFGLDYLQRIDDDMDQYWTVTGELSATAIAKHPGYSQNFVFINSDDDFASLLYAPYRNAQSGSSTDPETGDVIRFGLTRGVMPEHGNKPAFSSDPLDNVICQGPLCLPPLDHMVSWLITDGEYAGDYVLAWKDLKFRGDRDYSYLVVRVSGVSVVPVPAAVWLFGSGLLVLIAAARRRSI